MKERILNQERYKRIWCLHIKGKDKKADENPREDVVRLLSKIAPDLAEKLKDTVDIFHRVGRKIEDRHRQIIILFLSHTMRDEIWKQTKNSMVCKNEGIPFTEHLTHEDWRSRQAMWPRIKQARKEGKAAGFRGPFGFINSKSIREKCGKLLNRKQTI